MSADTVDPLNAQLAFARGQGASTGQLSLLAWQLAYATNKRVILDDGVSTVDPHVSEIVIGGMDVKVKILGSGLVQSWSTFYPQWVNLGYGVAVTDQPASGFFHDVGSVFSDIGSALASIPGDIVGAVGALLKLVVELVQAFGSALDGLLQLAEFILSIVGDLLALVDPTGTSASRRAAIANLSPFHLDGPVYNFLTSDHYSTARRLMILIIVAPAAILMYPIIQVVLGSISPQLANALSPGNMADALMDALSAIVKGIATGQGFFSIVQAVVDEVLLNVVGIKCSDACLLKITYYVLSGLPIPPIPLIIITLLDDPVAQKSIATLVGVPAISDALPVAMSCFDVADGGSWLDCFEAILEELFPAVVSTLRKYSIDLNDLRTVLQSAWSTGGDLNLMFKSNVVGNTQQFSAAPLSNLPPVMEAFVSIGFFGVGFLANAIGIQQSADFFIDTFGPLLPSDVRAQVQSSYDVFRFTEAMMIEGKRVNTPLTPAITPVGLSLYLLETFHDNKWDVQNSMSAIIADELDPSSGSTKIFSSSLQRTSDGKFIVSPAFKALATKLSFDFPKMKYQLDALCSHLSIETSSAVGNSSTITAAATQYSKKIPSSPKPVSQGSALPVSTKTTGVGVGLPVSNTGVGSGGKVMTPATNNPFSLGAGGGTGLTSTSSKPKSSTVNLPLVGAAALAAALIIKVGS